MATIQRTAVTPTKANSGLIFLIAKHNRNIVINVRIASATKRAYGRFSSHVIPTQPSLGIVETAAVNTSLDNRFGNIKASQTHRISRYRYMQLAWGAPKTTVLLPGRLKRAPSRSLSGLPSSGMQGPLFLSRF